MATTATSAQAVPPDWLILHPETHENELVIKPIVFQTESDSMMGIASKVLGVAVTILCKDTKLENGALEEKGKVSGTYVFSECETLINGKASKVCEIKLPIEAKFKGQAFSHKGAGYLFVAPVSGTTFATISFGEECVIGEKVPLTGTFVEKWCDNAESYAVRHLAEQAPAALFVSGEYISALKFGSSEATLNGSIWQKLASGREWKYMP